MADFLSDTDDEKAIDELLSQAMDISILEQIAAINCADLNDSILPSNLETRFQKLKSFSSSTEKPVSLSTKSFNIDHSVNEPNRSDSSEDLFSNYSKKCPEEKNCLTPSKSFESGRSSPSDKHPDGKFRKKETKSLFSTSSLDGLSSRSVSPPVKSGCFLCSPKKVSSRKRNKENRGFDLGLDWGKNGEFLSDLSNFSSKTRKDMMMKAMEEEEKISREAEKIVKWAKHASARMEILGIEDELSD